MRQTLPAAPAGAELQSACLPAALPEPLPEPLPRYLEHLQVSRRVAARTLTLYTDALRRLVAGLADLGVALPLAQPQHLRRLTAQLHGQGLAPRTLALQLSAWRGLYRWWGREGGVAVNPVDGLRPPKAGKPLPKALAVDQAVALAAMQSERGALAWRVRDHAMVELLYSCGLRVAELIGLDAQAGPGAAGWIDAADATVHVLGKGSKRRSVPVGGPALQALAAWLAERALVAPAGESALFISNRGSRLSTSQVRSRLKALAIEAGLPTAVHPHMLRHSYASHLLQSSGDLRGVQELLGHANISSTQIYTQLDFQHLAKVYDAAHPRAKRRPE